MTGSSGWRGRFYEDFEVGDVYESRIGRTVSEADNTWFTLATNNTNQLHFNREYARSSGLRDCIVNSALTLSIVAGLSVTDVSQNGINLGWSSIELPNAVFPGDTLYARSEVLAVRDSRSRPKMGIVTIRTEGVNQHGTCVIRYERSIMTWKKAYAPEHGRFPSGDGSDSASLERVENAPSSQQHFLPNGGQ
jgi:itaconyl-CoA hydratase